MFWVSGHSAHCNCLFSGLMVFSGLRSFVNNDNLQVLIIITFSSAPEFLVCLIFVMFYASCPLEKTARRAHCVCWGSACSSAIVYCS